MNTVDLENAEAANVEDILRKNYVICAAYDKKSETYLAQEFHDNTEIGIRKFVLYCRDQKSLFSQFPDDYEYHLIGYFNPYCERKQLAIEGTLQLCLITARGALELDKVQDKNTELVKERITDSNIREHSV